MLNIKAISVNDLIKTLNSIDITVFPRTQGRTTEQCERWSICRFISTYAETALLEFPLELGKRERPDFLLTLPSKRVGIEITEAIPPNWAWASAVRVRHNHANMVYLQQFTPGEPKLSPKEIDAIARSVDPGDGWAGDAPEREWANAMAYIACAKAQKLDKYGYDKFDNNWLLIYDNWPLPAVDFSKAASFLTRQIADLDAPLPFDRIFVESGHAIWEFGESSSTQVPIRDLWSNH